MKSRRTFLIAASLSIFAATLSAQERSAAAWTAHVASEYSRTTATYLSASNIDLNLDVYTPRGLAAPNPVVVYYHGGGWGGGTKEHAFLSLTPYLEMGFTVVNVEYRGARVALAPAAVEDCRCALLWVVANAARHNFDAKRIVLTGDSAGSHLALMSGLLTPAAGLDRQCPSAPVAPSGAADKPEAAAIVSWYGATDVNDLLAGPNARGFAIAWLGTQPNREEIARRVSPMTYVRPGAPAVFTVHGDADGVVPLNHATRLHADLTKHDVPNRLFTVAGGGHGGFTREQNEKAFAALREFLGERGLLPARK